MQEAAASAQAGAAQDLGSAKEAATASRQRCLELLDSLRTAARQLLRIDAAVSKLSAAASDDVVEPVTPVRGPHTPVHGDRHTPLANLYCRGICRAV